MSAERILHATQILYGAGGLDFGHDRCCFGGKPAANGYFRNMKVVSNQYVYNRTSSTSTWFLMQAKKGFAYMENWPITVQQAPANSEAEFTQDVTRFKVSERGAAAVLDPRYAVKSTS